MSRTNLAYLFLCLLITLSACTADKPSANNNFAHPPDPDKQKELYILPGLEHGLLQSPINILSFKEKTTEAHEVTLHFQDEIEAVQNLGHTVQLDFSEGSTISYDGLTYTFKQIHFHTPSEHLIDGITFPMEMHVVTNVPAEDKDDFPRYLVVGFLFKMGKANKFIDDFLNLIPKTEDTATPLESGTVKVRDVFTGTEQRDVENYYHYRGSLTTPPYTETVEWFVYKDIIEASPEQIAAINVIQGDNARRIQGTFGRIID
jgi:carbonic anhydrase